MKLFAACLLMTVVSACAHGPATDSWCLTNSPIRPTDAEIAVMSDETVTQILAHNEFGAKLCGWVP